MKTEDKIEIAEIVRAVMREELGGQTFQDAFSKFATKDDLEGLAKKYDFDNMLTKDDLDALAKKYDFDNMVTKDDLKGFATKDDIKNMATKDDIKGFATTDALLSFRDYFQEEIEDLRVEMRTDMLSRKDFFDYMTMFEDALQEMRDHRTGRLLSEKQLATMDDKVANHENRIRVLERHSA